ncbi:hypothetical protein DL93DRAFT_2122975 [Clavulina sp. PMI_390]|nr:hypothetical protein DL93DRAFT_2122975 [Clavulina sp. PMI_390]
METIGIAKFSALLTDSTSNMKAARDLIAREHPHILILPDICHLMNNMVKDIVKLPYFAPAKTGVQSITKHFKKSSFARAHLDAARLEAGVSRGIAAMGNTRFVGMYWSGKTVLDIIPLVKKLIQDNVLKLKKNTGIYWMVDQNVVQETQDALEHLLPILEPIARAVKCLESSHATPASVYLFWLAILATLEELFRNNKEDHGLRLPEHVIKDVRRIVTRRWKESTQEGNSGNANGGTVYLAAVVFDPSLLDKSSLFTCHNHNPLAPSITLPGRCAPNPLSPPLPDADLWAKYPCYVEVGKFLFSQILAELSIN